MEFMKIRKNSGVLQIFFLVIICITGCESDNNKPNMDFIYPLTVGNNWQYDMIFILDFDSLATSNGFIDTTYFSTGSVEIITNEIIFDSLAVYNIATTITETGNVFTGNEYYR